MVTLGNIMRFTFPRCVFLLIPILLSFTEGCRVCNTPYDPCLSTFIDRHDDERGGGPMYRAGSVFPGSGGGISQTAYDEYNAGEATNLHSNAGNYGITTPMASAIQAPDRSAAPAYRDRTISQPQDGDDRLDRFDQTVPSINELIDPEPNNAPSNNAPQNNVPSNNAPSNNAPQNRAPMPASPALLNHGDLLNLPELPPGHTSLPDTLPSGSNLPQRIVPPARSRVGLPSPIEEAGKIEGAGKELERGSAIPFMPSDGEVPAGMVPAGMVPSETVPLEATPSEPPLPLVPNPLAPDPPPITLEELQRLDPTVSDLQIIRIE